MPGIRSLAIRCFSLAGGRPALAIATAAARLRHLVRLSLTWSGTSGAATRACGLPPPGLPRHGSPLAAAVKVAAVPCGVLRSMTHQQHTSSRRHGNEKEMRHHRARRHGPYQQGTPPRQPGERPRTLAKAAQTLHSTDRCPTLAAGSLSTAAFSQQHIPRPESCGPWERTRTRP